MKLKVEERNEFKVTLDFLAKRAAYLVKSAREKKYLSQEEMRFHGYTRRTIQRIESGKADLTMSDFLKINLIFEIPLECLLHVPKRISKKIEKNIPLEKDDYLVGIPSTLMHRNVLTLINKQVLQKAS